MKRLFLVLFVFTIFVNFLNFSSVHAGDVFRHGNYTSNGVIDGNLVVVDGDINLASGDLTVYGGIHVISGSIEFSGGGMLFVAGDVILTNTNTTGTLDAHVSITGDAIVGGSIQTKSLNGNAYVHLDGNSRTMMAGNITTHGKNDSFVGAIDGGSDVVWNSVIDVDGGITTKSGTGHAYVGVYAQNGNGGFGTEGNIARISTGKDIHTNGNSNLYGAYVGTNGNDNFDNSFLYIGGNITVGNKQGDAYIRCGEIYVCGEMQTTGGSDSGDAFIYTTTGGGIVAGDINTMGYGDCSITATAGSLKVTGDLNVRSSNGNGRVYAKNSLCAASVSLYALEGVGICSVSGDTSVVGSIYSKRREVL